MDTSEYDRWRQHLEEDLEAAFDLVRAGVKAQLRVLDRLRLEAAATGGLRTQVPELPTNSRPRFERAAPPTSPSLQPNSSAVPPTHAAPPVIPAPAAPEERKRRPAGELYNLVLAALPELPEVFDSRMLQAKLQPPPKKATLYQTLQTLESAGWIERLASTLGAKSIRFRQLPDVEEEDGDEECEAEALEEGQG